jgi:tight adherence protein B
VTGLALGLTAALGTYLLYSAVVMGWSDLPLPRRLTTGDGPILRWSLHGPPLAAGGLAALGALALFGAVVPVVVAGGLGAAAPLAAARSARESQTRRARDAWPRLIEEMRLQTGALGRSVPQALFAVGRRAPAEMAPAFDRAEREWQLTTDFERTISVLKAGLADATADATLETLLVAHQIGGTDLDGRLAALVEDRILDQQGRKDTEAKQAGVRFARRFVLIVPAGMALAGLSIGTGRQAYQSPLGQAAVAAGMGVIALCWWWAGRLMRLPGEERVFVS